MVRTLWPRGLQRARLLVLHRLPEFAQTHVHWVLDNSLLYLEDMFLGSHEEMGLLSKREVLMTVFTSLSFPIRTGSLPKCLKWNYLFRCCKSYCWPPPICAPAPKMNMPKYLRYFFSFSPSHLSLTNPSALLISSLKGIRSQASFVGTRNTASTPIHLWNQKAQGHIVSRPWKQQAVPWRGIAGPLACYLSAEGSTG